jgi:amidase
MNGQVLPHPPVLRGLDLAIDVLKQNGHKVVPWSPYRHDFAVDLINKIYAADGCTVKLQNTTQKFDAARGLITK